MTKALASIHELEQILNSVANRQEFPVYKKSLHEIYYSLLSVSIGNYRHAYSSLRLFFELCLAAVEFSTDLKYFRSWELGKDDIIWSRLSDDQNGVMSKNFCNLFLPELSDDIKSYRTMATTVYRECSEFVHGNPKATSTLPNNLEFKRDIPIDWANKLDTMCLVITFIFSVRYLMELSVESRENIKELILTQLSNLKPIREVLGGTVGG